MKVGVVVSENLKQYIAEIARNLSPGLELEIISLPFSTISMLTTDKLAQILKSVPKARSVDILVIPGSCEGSATVIERVLGIRTVKGPTHLEDLRILISNSWMLRELSSEEPAELVIPEPFLRHNLELLERVERCVHGVLVGKVVVPLHPPPMRIVAEVTEAHKRDPDEVVERAKKLVEEGAHIVSAGFEAWSPRPDCVKRIISKLVAELDTPIAIDSLIPSEIRAAIEAGAEMVLSIDLDNIEKVYPYARGVLCVAIPYSSSRGWIPREPSERLDLVVKLIEKARRLGFSKLAADLILDPPIIGAPLKVLYYYTVLKEKLPEIPTLVGVGNVVELADVDSVGMNALLVFLALEAGISMLLTVEKSYKAQGSARELATAIKMATIAWAKGAPPKNLGIDLLIAKKKRPPSSS